MSFWIVNIDFSFCTVCQTEKCQKCVFPFGYKGKKYYNCTNDGLDNDLTWCATDLNGNGNVERDEWGHCKPGCVPPKGKYNECLSK